MTRRRGTRFTAELKLSAKNQNLMTENNASEKLVLFGWFLV